MENTMHVNDFMKDHSSPNYSFVFDFERNFDTKEHLQWFTTKWHYAFYYSGLYVLMIFVCQQFMKSRSRFELKGVLAVWSAILAVFSIFGLSRTLPELVHVIREYGFTYSVCYSTYMDEGLPSAFWSWLFTVSKVPELGDTFFIILRKQRLIFLHWYHHITVMLFCWYSYQYHLCSGRWYVNMNYFAHSMMYTYYTMKAMNIKMPRFLPIVVTSTQILQMVAGCFVTCFGYMVRRRGDTCHMPDHVAYYAMIMYLSYFVLFAQFFYKAYITTPATTAKKVE